MIFSLRLPEFTTLGKSFKAHPTLIPDARDLAPLHPSTCQITKREQMIIDQLEKQEGNRRSEHASKGETGNEKNSPTLFSAELDAPD